MTNSQKFTPKQARFVEEYLIDLDPKRAAIAAGYRSSTAASKAYQWVSNGKTNPHIYAAVKKAQAARSKRAEITQDMVVAELVKIAFADITDTVEWGIPKDEPQSAPMIRLLASNEMTRAATGAVAEVSMTAAGLKVKMHDKQAALVILGKHLGMFREKAEPERRFAELTAEAFKTVAAASTQIGRQVRQ